MLWALVWERTDLQPADRFRPVQNQMASATTAPLFRPLAASEVTIDRDRAAPTSNVGAGFVRRAKLVRRLVRTSPDMIVVIVAPPGYGKSSVLSEWAAQDERPFVSLKPADLAGGALLDSARIPGHAADALKRPIVVALDDAHLVATGTLRRLLDGLANELPEGSTLVLASRTQPAIPLARLRANRRLIEVQIDDLQMTPAEASTLLQRAGVQMSFSAVETIVRRTGGWPAALYLSALTLREQSGEAFTEVLGDDHRLAEYFRDEVLSTLSRELREFAVRTSVLDELSGATCDTVLGRPGSGLLLVALARACSLLRPLDRAHERYRWHSLIRDELRAELRKTKPEQARSLHLRASTWYRARGELDQAIDHAISARDYALTGSLLWTTIVQHMTNGRNDMVQRWLARLPRHELAAHPPLALSAAYSFLVGGDTAQARHWAVVAAAAVERGADMPERDSLAAGVAGIEAVLASAGVAAMRASATRACALEPPGSPWLPVHMFVRATALHLSGEREAAGCMLEQVADLSAAAAPCLSALALAQAGMIAIEQRDWETASELAHRAGHAVEEHSLADYPVCALVFAALAAARAHEGRADEAKHDLRRGIDLLAALGDFIPWYGAQARILLAHASLWLADVVRARALLAEASRLARRTHGAVIFQQLFDDAWSYIDTMAETSLAGPSALTIAELRILRFLPSHRSFREIAAQLGVSANTVKTQAHAVYRKLGAASRSEAVTLARDAGLLGQ